MPAPRRKRLNCGKRLNVAKEWVTAYSGGDLVRGYTKWFGVSEVCAIVELRKLGVEIPEPRLELAKRNEKARAARRAARKQKPAGMDGWVDADDTLAFVAGFTPGGAPYGVEQDEADAAWDQDLVLRRMMDGMEEDDDLPF